MRKQDYQILATAINRQVRLAKVQQETIESGIYYEGKFSAVCALAREFAESASVDKSAFLRACGIE